MGTTAQESTCNTRLNAEGVLTVGGGDDVGPGAERNRSKRGTESDACADRVGGASLWPALQWGRDGEAVQGQQRSSWQPHGVLLADGGPMRARYRRLEDPDEAEPATTQGQQPPVWVAPVAWGPMGPEASA